MEELIKNYFKDTNGNITSVQEFISKYLPVIIIFIISILVINFIMGFIKKIVNKSKLPKNIHSFVLVGIKSILYFIVILSICSRLGVDITSLVAAFSIVGVAVSLSIQNALSNVMAGFSLLFTKYFDVDDYVDIGGVGGTVMRIGLSACKLKTPDGKDIYVPNSNIISQNIINYSKEPFRRVDITIGTPYTESVDKVKSALQSIIDSTPEVQKDREIFLKLTNFGESAIEYTIRVWVKNSDYWNVYFTMLEKIKRTFEEENIDIPFNQIVVHKA